MRMVFAALAATAFIWGCEASAATVDCSDKSKQFTDLQGYVDGQYASWLAPWNREDFVQGFDYTECIGLEPSVFPGGQKIAWNWPDRPPRQRGVYSFLAVDFGNYDHSVVKKPIPPKAVADIGALRQAFNLTLSAGDPEAYNVIQNMFLTSAPGDQDKKLFEIEIFLHTPSNAARYVLGQTPIGEFTVSGRKWTATIDRRPKTAPDILIVPNNLEDVPSSSIDINGILNNLVRAGILTGHEYFNGMALGVEVIRGSGSISINQIATEYR